MGNLVHHLEPHVLKHGQDIGQGNLVMRIIDLEPDLIGSASGPAQVHGQFAAGEGMLKAGDIGERRRSVGQLLVAWRERLAVAVQEP